MYTVKVVTDRQKWDTITGAVLLQSWNWGDFQERIGKKVYRLGVFLENELIGAAQVIVIKSALRSHLYIPNGPVVADQQQYILDAHKIEEITESILQYCRKNIVNASTHFIRIDPLVIDSIDNHKLLHDLGLIPAATYVQPERTVVIDLKKSEKELLAQMSITQRYGVRKGQKEGIKITHSTDAKDFDIFWAMYKDTVQRQHFVAYSKNYYWQQIEALKENGNYSIYIAYDKETPVAASLIGSDVKMSYYLHSGRSNVLSGAGKHAMKVLLWQAILDAKQAGKEYFNLYGIAKNDEDKHDPWCGFSEFKKSFGGDIINYVGSLDFPITLNYWLIRLLEKTRRVWGYPYFLAKKVMPKS